MNNHLIIGVIGNHSKKNYFEIVDLIFKKLKKYNCQMILSNDFLLRYPNQVLNDEILIDENQNIFSKVNMILSVGGDGTLLSTVRMVGKNPIPILGVHIGRLGFLAGCNLDDLDIAIKHIVNGDYIIEKRSLIKCMFNLEKNKNTVYALNDIVVHNRYSGRLLNIKVSTNNELVNTYLSDGIIFSTPTGSTAYSLSAGGPIIHYDLETITLTPICPHSLSARPIVLSDKTILNITFPDHSPKIGLSVDGQIKYDIDSNTEIRILKANYYARLIQFSFNKYFSSLKNKMGWVNEVR